MQVSGRFDGLDPATKTQLLAEQADHDVLVSAFSPEGSLTYSPSLTRFTLRYLLTVTEASAAEADEAAVVEGELLARELLDARGLTHKSLTTSSTCLEDVKRR